MVGTTKMGGIFILAVSAMMLTVYSCSKKTNGRIVMNQEDRVLFEDNRELSSYSPGELLLGGNVKKVVAVGVDHPVFKRIQSLDVWKQASKGVALDLTGITRTYVHSSDASLITVPVRTGGNVREYFNVYVSGDKILLTRFSEEHHADGLTTCKVLSATGELYYQFDLNSRNQIGNWKFDKELPKLSDTGSRSLLTGRDAVDCGKKKFNSCMSCVIIDVCGSDWICSIACGLAIPSCVGGAALYCLLS